MVTFLDSAIVKICESPDNLNWVALVLDSMNAGLLITDPLKHDNPITFANKHFCEMTGYSREEIIGRNCRFLQGEGTDREVVNKIRFAVDNAEQLTCIIKNYKKNGDSFWNKLHIAPVKNNADKVVSFVGIQHDVTKEVLLGKLKVP